MYLYFIRHGESGQADPYDRFGVDAPKLDIYLSEEGKEQAAARVEELKEIPFTRIYSSPLGRAIQTAQIATADYYPRLMITAPAIG